MNLQAVSRGNQNILEGTPATPLLRSPEDVVDVIGACFEHSTRLLLLNTDNLTEHFFDLSSGEAGAILQKLRNYHIKLAVLLPQDGVHQTSRFREMAAEERQGGDFRMFEDTASAEAWLTDG